MNDKAKADFNAVEKIATYAANLQFEDLTELTVTRARQVVLDTLGTALGGYQFRLGCLGQCRHGQVSGHGRLAPNVRSRRR